MSISVPSLVAKINALEEVLRRLHEGTLFQLGELEEAVARLEPDQ